MFDRLKIWWWFKFNTGAYSTWRPKRTKAMQMRGTVWALLPLENGHTWHQVCDFCGGNCGQCGLTSIVGNVGFSFQRIVDNHLAGTR